MTISKHANCYLANLQYMGGNLNTCVKKKFLKCCLWGDYFCWLISEIVPVVVIL